MRFSIRYLAFVGALAACADPPPPSLSQVTIVSTSNDDGTSIQFIRLDNGEVQGDASKGIVVGDGFSVLFTLDRKIADPPDDTNTANQLLTKPFTLTVQGDVFTVDQTPTASRIILSSVKPGDGTLVFAVPGAQGTISMPVKIVDQSAVPPDTYPPDVPPPVDEAGTTDDSDAAVDGGADATDAAAEAGE